MALMCQFRHVVALRGCQTLEYFELAPEGVACRNVVSSLSIHEMSMQCLAAEAGVEFGSPLSTRVITNIPEALLHS